MDYPPREEEEVLVVLRILVADRQACSCKTEQHATTGTQFTAFHPKMDFCWWIWMPETVP